MNSMIAPSRPVPPAHMRLFQGARPLKRWRYVGVFCDELMICAASIHVGPAPQTFWAVFDRAEKRLLERTHLFPRRGALDLTPGRLRIRDDSIALDLVLAEEAPIEATCPHGDSYVWTRKQAGTRAHGTLVRAGEPARAIEARAVIDDTAGYHARITEWRWAAGVGASKDGTPIAFNLVEGINDPLSGSERALWIGGVPHEAPPVHIAADLCSIVSADGAQLRFTPEAERRRSDNLLLVRSEYRAPFGSFSGALPGGVELMQALGVVEYHSARW